MELSRNYYFEKGYSYMEASTTIAALQASYAFLKDVGGFALNERDRQKFTALNIDLTDKIIQAQANIIQIQDAITSKGVLLRALQERISDMERDERERGRYQLTKLGTAGDFFAYKLRPAGELTERSDEPEHFLRQSCFDAGKKGILRIIGSYCSCPICHAKTTIAPSATNVAVRQVASARPRDW